ncbi:MAG: hypothetical protein AMXMBFR7_06370 [Planctomycetota bacterium]
MMTNVMRVWSLRAAALLLAFGAGMAWAGEDPHGGTIDPHGKLPDPHAGHKHGSDPHGAPAANEEPEEKLPPAVLEGELDFRAIESLAIQEGGRKKPLHTYAVESLEQICGRSIALINSAPTFKDPSTGAPREAIDLFLAMWLNTRQWYKEPVVLVSHRPLRVELGLDPAKKHFSIQQLIENETFNKLYGEALAKRHAEKEKEMSALEQEAELVGARLELMRKIVTGEAVHIVPHPADPDGTWISLREFRAIEQNPPQATEIVAQQRYSGHTELAQKLVMDYANNYTEDQLFALNDKAKQFMLAYRARDKEAFSKTAADLRTSLASMSPGVYPDQTALLREIRFNEARPFGSAWRWYMIAAVVCSVALKFANKPFYLGAWGCFVLGLGYHIWGFTQRCLIAGRPPVTNMYESVIWVGFGCVAFALAFEALYRTRYYLLGGAMGGFLCLMLMDLVPYFAGNAHLPGFEAKINPLVPVLRDNFWLTVHVLTITASYAAFALAWLIAHVTLGSYIVTPGAQVRHRQLHGFVYRVVQVGVLLLATGTILGGVWAYYSWGRFWGWDPKETWAFIALLCYLVFLHGRFTGWWGNFGLSVGAVVSFISVVMAWYGVNFVLGSGLHSYGAGANMGQQYVLGLVCLDLLFVTVAIWRNYAFRHDSNAEEPDADAEEKLTATDPIDEELEVTAKA